MTQDQYLSKRQKDIGQKAQDVGEKWGRRIIKGASTLDYRGRGTFEKGRELGIRGVTALSKDLHKQGVMPKKGRISQQHAVDAAMLGYKKGMGG